MRIGFETIRRCWLIALAVFLLFVPACGDVDFGGGIGGTGTGTGTGSGTITNSRDGGGEYAKEDDAGTESADTDAVAGSDGDSGDGKESTIVLNRTHHLELLDSSAILMDGVPVPEEEVLAKGSGLIASVITRGRYDSGYYASDDDSAGGDEENGSGDGNGDVVNKNITQATATRLSINHLIIGPVTYNGWRLRVLGQPVRITNATVLKGFRFRQTLEVGMVVEVSGYADRYNRILATRIELKEGPVPVWKLTGPVSWVEPGHAFAIGRQWVSLWGVQPLGCGGSLDAGEWVEVFVTPEVFYFGGMLTHPQLLGCITTALDIPDGEQESLIPAEIEGIIHTTGEDGFSVGQQVVTLSSETKYTSGRLRDIAPGRHVLVRGVLDVHSRVLHAVQVHIYNE